MTNAQTNHVIVWEEKKWNDTIVLVGVIKAIGIVKTQESNQTAHMWKTFE